MPSRTTLITWEGDSITVAQGATRADNGFASLIAERPFYALIDDVNLAKASSVLSGGNTASLNLTDVSRYGIVDGLVNPLHFQDILGLWIGTNDGALLAKTGAQTATDLFAYLDARIAAGRLKSKIGLITMLPRDATGTALSQGALNTFRSDLNGAIRANWSLHSGALWDIASTADFSPDGNFVTADFADGVHPSDAGNLKIANFLDPLVQAMVLS